MEQPVLIGYMRISKADGSQTLYRHVDPNGLLRPDGQKLLS